MVRDWAEVELQGADPRARDTVLVIQGRLRELIPGELVYSCMRAIELSITQHIQQSQGARPMRTRTRNEDGSMPYEHRARTPSEIQETPAAGRPQRFKASPSEEPSPRRRRGAFAPWNT